MFAMVTRNLKKLLFFKKYESDSRRKAEPAFGGHDPRTAVQLRSLSTVLKRLKEIMEGKSQVL